MQAKKVQENNNLEIKMLKSTSSVKYTWFNHPKFPGRVRSRWQARILYSDGKRKGKSIWLRPSYYIEGRALGLKGIHWR